jgi:hypothetical protein
MKEQLREKEDQYNKEVKMKQKLEIRVRELDMDLKTVRHNLNTVSGLFKFVFVRL